MRHSACTTEGDRGSEPHNVHLRAIDGDVHVANRVGTSVILGLVASVFLPRVRSGLSTPGHGVSASPILPLISQKVVPEGGVRVVRGAVVVLPSAVVGPVDEAAIPSPVE